MKVLVTGADGFIGSHLVETLVRRGMQVKALCQYNSQGHAGWMDSVDVDLKSDVEVVFGDCRDPYQMMNIVKNQDAICHLAALIAIPFSYAAPDSYVQTNVQGTLNLLNAARSAGVDKFIHTSTSEVYGTAKYVPMDEKHELQGQSPYSASKIAADMLVKSFHNSFDLKTVTIRPFNTFGPRQSARAVIPTIISQLASGVREVKLGALAPTRDFTYVQDTVMGFIRALELVDGFGEVYNLGSGFEISIGEIFFEINTLMGLDAVVVEDEKRLRPVNSEVERLFSDNRKAATRLGWAPEMAGKDGFREGLKLTIDWFMDASNLKMYRPNEYAV